MENFISALYAYVCEHTPAIQNYPEHEQALQAYMEIEEEVKEKIGSDLLYKYQCAESAVSHQWEVAVFLQTLRFSHRFLLEVLN